MTDYQGMVTRGMPIAAIDLGTVSSRLLLAEIRGKCVVGVRKRTIITDLGERVDATGLISEAAIERVVDACRGFVDEIRDFGAVAVCTTLTSAARDAANGEALLAPLRELGLAPQVIPGEVEARLTFLGVAHDFPASSSRLPIRGEVQPRSQSVVTTRTQDGSSSSEHGPSISGVGA